MVVDGRGLFATHYAKLADAHEGSTDVAIRHMACEVTKSPSGCEQVWLVMDPKGCCGPHRLYDVGSHKWFRGPAR